jgi:hypothetical protein
VEIAYPNIILPTSENSPARSTTSLTHHQQTPFKADATPYSTNREPRNIILLDLVESAEKEATLPIAEPLLE